MMAATQPVSPALPTQTPQIDDDNPWPGLDSYTEAAQRFFHGRDQDTAELVRLIRLSPFVTLYSKSGLGKSSMLKAGVFPQLRAAHYLPVYLRLDYREGAEPPLAQALALLLEEIKAAGADAAPPDPGEGLWAYLQRRELPIWSADNFPLTPVLVFDQFEEVFSRGGSAAHVKQVLDRIADLAGDRLPAEIAKDREAMRRLKLDGPQYRLVLSFRSDFLAEIESWELAANLPRRESLHLKAMTRETAVEAVERAGAAVLEPGVAAQIVDFVLDRNETTAAGRATEVEPVLLSLCCYQLNTRRQRPGKIDSALLKSVGADILQGFYDEALHGMAPRVAVFIEDNLIVGGRYRGNFPRDEALASGALTAEELDHLMARRLLRVDPQGDVPRIELIHDRLVGVVRDQKARRIEREREQKLREQRAGAEAEARKAHEQKSARRRLYAVMGVLSVACLYFGGLGTVAWKQRNQAQASAARAQALWLGLQAQGMLSGTVAGGDAQAFQQLLAARTLSPTDPQAAPLFQAVASRAHLRAFEPVVAVEETPALALAFTPPGQPVLLVAGHEDGSVSLRDPEQSGSVLARTPGHSDMVLTVEVSPDGQRMVSASEDGTLLRWRLQPLAPEGAPLRGHDRAVTSAHFSPDGRRIVSSGIDGTVRLWDADTGAMLAANAPAGGTAIQAAQFRPDPLIPAIAVLTGVAGIGLTSSLILLDPKTLTALSSPQYAHTQDALALAVSPSGEFFATGGEDHAVRVRNWASASGRGGLQASSVRMDGGGIVTSVAFSPNGRWMASGNDAGEVRLWQVSGGAAVGQPLEGLQPEVSSVAFSADGRWLAASGPDGILELWPLEPRWSSAPANARKAPPEATSVALGRGGKPMLFGLRNGSLVLRDATQADRLLPFTGAADAGIPPRLACKAPAVSEAKAAAPAPTRAYLRNVRTAVPPELVLAVAVTADGRTAVSTHFDGTLRRWDVASGQAVGKPLQISNCPLDAVDISADGRRVVVANRDGAVLLLDAEGKELSQYAPPPRPAERLQAEPRGAAAAATKEIVLALSDDGRQIAMGGRSNEIVLYTQGLAEPTRIAGVVEPITSLAFSPDGSHLVGGSGVGGVRLWNVASRAALGQPMPVGGGSVTAVSFASDGKLFHSLDSRGDVREWAAPGTWVALMCGKLGSNLSRADWKDWVSPDIDYRCACPGLPIEPDAPAAADKPVKPVKAFKLARASKPATADKPEICPAAR